MAIIRGQISLEIDGVVQKTLSYKSKQERSEIVAGWIGEWYGKETDFAIIISPFVRVGIGDFMKKKLPHDIKAKYVGTIYRFGN